MPQGIRRASAVKRKPEVVVSGASYREVLRNRPFLALWLAQVISQTAQNAILYILLIFVEERTSSTLQSSALLLSFIVPSLILSLAAGVLVDHVRKKAVLVATSVLRGVAVLGYLVFQESLALIYLVNLIFSSVGQFFAPAEAAAIPLLVGKKHLLAANGLFNLTFTGAQLVGFVLVGPPMVKWLGPQLSFGIIAASFGVTALLTALLPPKEQVGRPLASLTRTTLWQEVRSDVKEAWRLIQGDPWVAFAMVYLTVSASLILVLAMLAPGYVSRVVGVRADDAILILAPTGVGMLLGAAILPSLGQRISKLKLIHLGLWVMFLSLALLAAVRRLREWAYTQLFPFLSIPHQADLILAVMGLALVVGLAYVFIDMPAQTLLQERTPVHLRGKVFAVRFMLGYLASVPPLLFLAGLADLFGITTVLLVVASLVWGIVLLSVVQGRRLRDLLREERVPATPSGSGGFPQSGSKSG